MNIDYWIDYFTSRKGSYQDPDWCQPCRISNPAHRKALADSIAIFQLGETGGGTRLYRFAATIGDPDRYPEYQRAIKLFIEEEHEHARLLKHLVHHLEGTCLQKQWTNSVFRRFRTIINLQFNIQVLLTAELIAEVYYALLARHTGDPLIEDVCQKILRDEVRHIAFHHDFFRERFTNLSPARAALWNNQFRLIHFVTTRIVWHDHRRCFKTLGVSRDLFLGLTRDKCRYFLHRLSKPLPHPQASPTSP